jgi:hypothetical protein
MTFRRSILPSYSHVKFNFIKFGSAVHEKVCADRQADRQKDKDDKDNLSILRLCVVNAAAEGNFVISLNK